MDTNAQCRVCGAPAYAGLLGVECSRGKACGVVATTPHPVLMRAPLKGFPHEVGTHANGEGIHVEHPLEAGALRAWREAWDEREAARREARDQHAPDPVTETTPEPTSWVPKVGEWARVRDDADAALYRGAVFRVKLTQLAASSDDHIVVSEGLPAAGFYASRLEPWAPRVGERVRVNAEILGLRGSGVVESAEGIYYRVRYDDGRGTGYALTLRELEPAQ